MQTSRILRLLGFLLLLASAPMVQAQYQSGVKMENLPNFDLRKFHFGFLLSYNNSDFYIKRSPSTFFTDSLKVLDHLRQPGFNLGIVASVNLNKNLSLRFLPGLSFQERILQYEFLNPDGRSAFYAKPVESTNLEFPLLLKLRSDRINNFAAYMIFGGKASLDMASQKDVDQTLDDEVVIKLQKLDYSVEAGAGVDFFLMYFKFGIELKHGIGIPNLLIDDGTRFSSPIESLRSKTWVLTFTFEG